MVIRALLLGLSTGLYCATACFPMLVSAMLSRSKSRLRDTSVALGQFLAGRLVAYLLVGAIAGLVGHFLGDFHGIPDMAVAAIFIVSGGLMALYGIVESFPHAKLCAAMSKSFQSSNYLLVLGLLTGLNICPPFVLAFSAAVDLKSFVGSVLFFFFFFLATSVYMLPFFFSGLAARKIYVRKAARIVSVVMGFWFVFDGIRRIVLAILAGN